VAARGQLRGVKLGDMTKVRRSELQRFMSELPAAGYVESCYSRRAASEALSGGPRTVVVADAN
jgi:hypothetical protein